MRIKIQIQIQTYDYSNKLSNISNGCIRSN
uniref:Uncharacterized protein n=1 Tax=Rhizophora mucronata TaxID=61149 RepID=A0A2P2QZZ3_RHIMU